MYTAFSITSPEEPLDCQKRSLEDAITNLPSLGVLIRVRAAGVCHSDLHQWKEGGIRLSETRILKYSERPGFEFPKVPGHEVSGTVHAFGSGVAPADVGLSVGDRVSVYPWMSCGECAACNSRNDGYCTGKHRELGLCIDGGYAEYVTVPHHKYLLPLPSGITSELGAMLGCSCLTAYSAVKSALSVVPGPLLASLPSVSVAVIGIGGLGQWALTLLPLLLPPTQSNCVIIAVDSNPEKLEVAKKLDSVSDGFLLDTAEPAKKESDRLKALHSLRGFNVVLDFVNNPFTFEFSVELLGKGGVLAAVGLFGGTGSLVLPLLSLKKLRIIGIMTGSCQDMRDVMDLVSSNIDRIEVPDTKFYRLEQCMEALNDLELGKIKGRAILKM